MMMNGAMISLIMLVAAKSNLFFGSDDYGLMWNDPLRHEVTDEVSYNYLFNDHTVFEQQIQDKNISFSMQFVRSNGFVLRVSGTANCLFWFYVRGSDMQALGLEYTVQTKLEYQFKSFEAPDYRIKEYLLHHISKNQMRNDLSGGVSVVVINAKDNFEFFIHCAPRNVKLDFHTLFAQKKQEYEEKFLEKFKINSSMGHAALGNLIGGISSFQGDWFSTNEFDFEDVQSDIDALDDEEMETKLVDMKLERKTTQESIKKLKTCTPSRAKFPRGFLWDEGFHLLVLIKFNESLALEIMESWFNSMNHEGWIPREQILGPEARSRVPSEFIPQSSKVANPPTFFLLLEKTSLVFLQRNFEKIKLYYEYLIKTQESKPNLFRWRGRTPGHNFASGLDDYPRTEPPKADDLHVDLQAWMSYASKVMSKIAKKLNKTFEDKKYEENLKLFWSSKDKAYGDLSNGVYVHKGYLSLVPWILGLDTHHDETMKLIEELLSPYGVRSLDANHNLYHKGDDYWRGNIWINFQFLILKRLWEIGEKGKIMYSKIRDRVLKTVEREYKAKNAFFENYSDKTGEGQRARMFTGWTSLILLIEAEMYE